MTEHETAYERNMRGKAEQILRGDLIGGVQNHHAGWRYLLATLVSPRPSRQHTVSLLAATPEDLLYVGYDAAHGNAPYILAQYREGLALPYAWHTQAENIAQGAPTKDEGLMARLLDAGRVVRPRIRATA